ncbi:ubiquinone biosynthesis protein coq9, mitochondrial [Plakobranchus ocellatus]|uniref:Ubiquinone biosynthesis protein n=1 Tax=Plakobranchus ocellatus TaxID=259542 RepID=A0AAV4AF70_9GAST|nr:ubiquinone biosynthesis protein coq9, mitochondrial [Plakobranchus ocellatus]
MKLSHVNFFMARTFSMAARKLSNEKGSDHTHSPEEHRDQFSSSAEEENSKGDEAQYEFDIRQRILSASLPYLQEFGWTQKALEAGAKDEGLPPIAHGMFPRGGAELVHYFYNKCNQELVEIMSADVEEAKAKGETLQITSFIRDAVEIRLRMIFPYMDIWPQAMAIQALPQNAVEAWSNTLNLMDEIWYYAGDRSTDFNWYTKRISLYGVYKATEIYMVQDKSADKADTWAFLDRRLKDLKTIGSTRKACQQSTDVLKEAVKGFSIMGRNILGFNSRGR